MTTTREQDTFIEGMASAYGGVRVMRLAPSQAPTAQALSGVAPMDVEHDLIVVPWRDGRQVAAPVFVPHDVGFNRLARAATAAEIARAQAWAERIGRAGKPQPCDALSLPAAVAAGMYHPDPEINAEVAADAAEAAAEAAAADAAAGLPRRMTPGSAGCDLEDYTPGGDFRRYPEEPQT
jgi:hypothetical protein